MNHQTLYFIFFEYDNSQQETKGTSRFVLFDLFNLVIKWNETRVDWRSC